MYFNCYQNYDQVKILNSIFLLYKIQGTNTDFFNYVRQFSWFPHKSESFVVDAWKIMRDTRMFYDSQWEELLTYGDDAPTSGTTFNRNSRFTMTFWDTDRNVCFCGALDWSLCKGHVLPLHTPVTIPQVVFRQVFEFWRRGGPDRKHTISSSFLGGKKEKNRDPPLRFFFGGWNTGK